MLLDVAADGVLKFGDGLEDAAPDAPSGDDGEETLDGIEPGGRGRREMEDPARMIGQPRLCCHSRLPPALHASRR